MKTWQWASIMWILCFICFYVSGEKWEPLICGFIFSWIAVISLLHQEVFPRLDGKK